MLFPVVRTIRQTVIVTFDRRFVPATDVRQAVVIEDEASGCDLVRVALVVGAIRDDDDVEAPRVGSEALRLEMHEPAIRGTLGIDVGAGPWEGTDRRGVQGNPKLRLEGDRGGGRVEAGSHGRRAGG